MLRPLYESSKFLAQKMTIAVRLLTNDDLGGTSKNLFIHYSKYLLQALRHIRQIAQETNGEIQYGGARQPAVLRTFSQRLCK